MAQDSVVVTKSHDTIVKRSGEKIIAKVVEVNNDNIRFKRIDNPDGPLYSLPKEQISMIVYANGSRELYEDYMPPKTTITMPVDLSMSYSNSTFIFKERAISEPEMLSIAGKQNENNINFAIQQTNNIKFWQDATLIGGFILLPVGLYEWAANGGLRSNGGYGHRGGYNGGGYTHTTSTANTHAKAAGEYMMLGALVSEITSIGFRIERKRHSRIVMTLYNKAIAQ
jgi:hypothetical protein